MWVSVHSFIVTAFYFVYYCTTGPPECSLTVHATAVTDTSITVMLIWTNCMGAEPSNISLRLSPATAQGPTVISSVRYDVSGLISNTNYSITASFTDACGSISATTVAVTLPSTSESSMYVISIVDPLLE